MATILNEVSARSQIDALATLKGHRGNASKPDRITTYAVAWSVVRCATKAGIAREDAERIWLRFRNDQRIANAKTRSKTNGKQFVEADVNLMESLGKGYYDFVADLEGTPLALPALKSTATIGNDPFASIGNLFAEALAEVEAAKVAEAELAKLSEAELAAKHGKKSK